MSTTYEIKFQQHIEPKQPCERCEDNLATERVEVGPEEERSFWYPVYNLCKGCCLHIFEFHVWKVARDTDIERSNYESDQIKQDYYEGRIQ